MRTGPIPYETRWSHPWHVPRFNGSRGLGFGTEGDIWVRLALHLCGLVQVPEKELHRLGQVLGESNTGKYGRSLGIWFGGGGVLAVSALLTRVDFGFQPVLRKNAEKWQRNIETSQYRDVYFGEPSALLLLAEISDLGLSPVSRDFIRMLHGKTAKELQRLVSSVESVFLGFAHGIAGLLMALEVSCAKFGLKRDASLHSKALERLFRVRTSRWGCSLWPRTDPVSRHNIQSYCHGTPGILLSLATCYYASGIKDYMDLREEACRGLKHIECFNDYFCCGTTGIAHILLEIYRQTGQGHWFSQARFWAQRIDGRRFKRGFLRGPLAHEYLKMILAFPELLPLPCTGYWHYGRTLSS